MSIDTQSVSSRSSYSAFPSSTTSISQGQHSKKGAGFVAPNSRRGGRDFKVVKKQQSDVSITPTKKDKSGRGFRKVLGDFVAGRSSTRSSQVEEVERSVETPRPKLVNKTSEWVQHEARRSQLRESELKRHEAQLRRRSELAFEALDDQSFYASDLHSDSDDFPAPPHRHIASGFPPSNTALSTFPNLSQLSLHDSTDDSIRQGSTSRSSTLLVPNTSDFAARRLSSRSSPQLRPLLLPRAFPSDPLPSVPFTSLPATPPASPPFESPQAVTFSRSTTCSSMPESGEADSLLAPSPTSTRKASHRQSYLPLTNALGLNTTTASPFAILDSPVSLISSTQKKFDTATRMLLKALSFDLVYLAKLSLSPPSTTLPPSLDILSSSGMPRPQPRFDPELHLSALHSSNGLLFRTAEQTSNREAYQTGLLMPIISMRKVGYLLCAFTKDERREVGERELRWIGKFAEELEGVVLSLGSR